MVFTLRPSAHLPTLATRAGLGTISRCSCTVRFVQGGVVITFRCTPRFSQLDTVDDNPYAPPRTLTEFIPSTEPRELSRPLIAAVGALLGVVACLASLAFIPSTVASAGEHDLRLANHLGFIYPPLVGLWAAWCRRSVPWAVYGVLSGLLVGALYFALCGYNFLAVMVAFPCLLGGVSSVLMGTQSGSWTAGLPQRFGRGLVAGLVLGFAYMVLLNIAAIFFMTFPRTVATHSSMMWRAAPIAMGVSSGFYLLLFHWSAGLGRTT